MSFATSQYVSVHGMDCAFKLAGEKALNLLKAGHVILAHGTFEDGGETGPAVFGVTRNSEKGVLMVAPLGSVDEYWGRTFVSTPSYEPGFCEQAKNVQREIASCSGVGGCCANPARSWTPTT